MTGVEKPNFLPFNLEVEVECPCDGSKFMLDVSQVKEWRGDGTTHFLILYKLVDAPLFSW